MPPRRQDQNPVDRDDAPDVDPEAPEGDRPSRATGRGSRKRRRRNRKKRRGAPEAAVRASDERRGDTEMPPTETRPTEMPPTEVRPTEAATQPAGARPEALDDADRHADVGAAPEGRRERGAVPAVDEGSLRRRARVAAYAHPVDAPHSSEDLESVAGLARELAELSTPETRSRLLAEAVAHAEAKEARYRVPMTEPGAALRWKAPLALAILAAAALAAVAPPTWVVPDAPAVLDAGARLHGIRLTLLLQAQQVEAFRAREQRLPESLDDVAVRFAGVRFVRSSSRVYQLVGYTPRGEAVVYDPADPGPDFERLGATWALSLHAHQAQRQ